MRQHISYAVLIAAIAAGLSTQVQGRASEGPVVEQQDLPFFCVPPGPGPGRSLLREPPAGTGSPGGLVGRARQVLGRDRRGSGRIGADVRRPAGDDHPGAHPLRPAERQRRHHGVAVRHDDQPGPGRHAGLPAERHDQRHDHGGRTWSRPAAPSRSWLANSRSSWRRMKKELAYANVHTNLSGGGEIRGQIKRWAAATARLARPARLRS